MNDDQHLVIIRLWDSGAAPRVVLVQNFFDELKRLVPN